VMYPIPHAEIPPQHGPIRSSSIGGSFTALDFNPEGLGRV
jgi:hypothetical protein